jgi:hypothetical protein
LDFASRETIHSTRWPTNKLHLQIFGWRGLADVSLTSYVVGGFGWFARMLSYDSNCSNTHFGWKSMNKCEWHDLYSISHKRKRSRQKRNTPTVLVVSKFWRGKIKSLQKA